MKTVIEKIHQHAQERPDHLAAAFEDGALNYGQLWNLSLRLSDSFKRLGLHKGDIVLCQGVFTYWFVVAFHATHLCEAIFVPVDKNASLDILENTARQMNAACILSSSKRDSRHIWLTFRELPELATSGSPDAEFTFPDMESPACIIRTTGTTGNPKAVVMSHRSLMGETIVRVRDIPEDDVCLSPVPLNHAAPFWSAISIPAYFGSAGVFVDGILRIKKIYEFIENYHVTSMFMPPAMFAALNQLGAGRLASYADQIRSVQIATSAISDTLTDFVTSILPKSLVLFYYGSSEVGNVCGRELQLREDLPSNCVGRIYDNVTVRIVDENMQDLPMGERGVILVKNNMLFTEYWNDPELTAKTFHDGFVITGDIGYVDEKRRLYLSGRADDIINIGGLKVFPTEIENEVEKFPGVAECICFPIPDPVTGQAVKLLVKKKEGAEVSLKELYSVLKQRIDAYKVPKSMEFTDEILRTPNGKPNRKAYTQKEAATV